jgi:hypothetical protein
MIVNIVVTLIGLGALYFILNEQITVVIEAINRLSEALGVPTNAIGQ